MSRVLRIGLCCAGIFGIGLVVFVALGIADSDRVRGDVPARGAMDGMVAIDIAQTQYFNTYGRFAASMQELGPPLGGPVSASGAGLIESDLASGERDGYKFAIQPLPVGYTKSAVSISPSSDSRSYFYGADHLLHVHIGPGAATENDPVFGKR